MAVVDIKALQKLIRYAEAEASASGLNLTAHLLQLAWASVDSRDMILKGATEAREDALSRFDTRKSVDKGEITPKHKLQ